MNKLWILFGCLALFGVLGHAEKPDYEYESDETDYYSKKKVDEANLDKPSDLVETDTLYKELNYDDINEEERKMYHVLTADQFDYEFNEDDKQDDIDDYQIEDNRSEVKEDEQDFGESDETIDNFDEETKKTSNLDVEPDEANKMYEDYKNYEEEVQEIPDIRDITKDFAEFGEELNTTKEIDNTEKSFNGTEDIDNEFSYDDDKPNFNMESIFNETQKILEETNESFDDDTEIVENANSSLEKTVSNSTEKYNIDEDTVAKAYSDLQDDLNNLRETWMKLKGEVNDANINNENLLGFDELNTKIVDMAEESKEHEDDYENIDDKDLFKLFKDFPEEEEDDDEAEEKEEETDEIESDFPIPVLQSDILSTKNSDKSKLIKYVDDALVANEDPEISHNKIESNANTILSTTHVPQKHQIEPLQDTSFAELNDFNEILLDSADPVKITLNLDSPVVITSPNYPNPYPTNAVIDWILEGEGRGIEFNITDFALNSIAGDYVMIKPGRVDASGDDGILLAHGLSSPRAFRFLNVDRMFIRFDSKLGLNRFRGFSFSAKMISALPEERILEPETLPIGYPHSTITLNLGGVTLEEFFKIQEDFRQIVADMATMYTDANGIEPGLNTTLEVTQITSTALCYHNWPEFENCVEVRFGVPLQYEDEAMNPRLDEEDLRDMWFTYANQNPFALRLERLGIKEFQIPNDNNILMVWLIIAAGVVISMAMLAFALWRFSCFEDYTRMPAFSDTESINEKKNLDLYPTPHQTLPPLYSDSEYKWGEAKYDHSTRVDMGGFPNRSYVRTGDYDFDSEEEVAVPARDRNSSEALRIVYNV